STATYKTRSLGSIIMWFNDVSGWNFASQDLRDSEFLYGRLIETNFHDANLAHARLDKAEIIRADFGHANLMNAQFAGANLYGPKLNGADTRGARDLVVTFATDTHNWIRPDWRILGLDLTAERTLTVRNYETREGWPAQPLSILVSSTFRMDETGNLRLLFDS